MGRADAGSASKLTCRADDWYHPADAQGGACHTSGLSSSTFSTLPARLGIAEAV